MLSTFDALPKQLSPSYATTFAQNAAQKGQIRIRRTKKRCQPGQDTCPSPLNRGSIRFDLHARRIFICQSHYIRCPSGQINKGCAIFTPDVYVSFLTTESGMYVLYATCTIFLGPEWGKGTSCSKWRLVMLFGFALWAHYIDLIGRSLHADIALIRRNTLASALCGSCRGCCCPSCGCCPQCLVAPSHCVCSEVALV
jgi:hypothetical protein